MIRRPPRSTLLASSAASDVYKRQIGSYSEINGINPNKINLYDLLPYTVHTQNTPIMFFVENITNLLGNSVWFERRKPKDIVLDTYGNLLYVENI